MNGKLGDDLTVQLDAGLGQSMHKLAVADPFGPAGRIDPNDPKLTEFRLALAAVGIGVSFRPVDRILCVTVEARLVPEISLCFLEDFLTAFAGCWYVACSRHDGFSCWS